MRLGRHGKTNQRTVTGDRYRVREMRSCREGIDLRAIKEIKLSGLNRDMMGRSEHLGGEGKLATGAWNTLSSGSQERGQSKTRRIGEVMNSSPVFRVRLALKGFHNDWILPWLLFCILALPGCSAFS